MIICVLLEEKGMNFIMKLKIILGIFIISILFFISYSKIKKIKDNESLKDNETLNLQEEIPDSESFITLMKQLPNTKKIILAWRTSMYDKIDENDKNYVRNIWGNYYKIIEVITEENKIETILKILSTAKYAKDLPAIGYKPLLQLYDYNDILIAEFQINNLSDKNSSNGIYFSDKNKEALFQFFSKEKN